MIVRVQDSISLPLLCSPVIRTTKNQNAPGLHRSYLVHPIQKFYAIGFPLDLKQEGTAVMGNLLPVGFFRG